MRDIESPPVSYIIEDASYKQNQNWVTSKSPSEMRVKLTDNIYEHIRERAKSQLGGGAKFKH